MSTSSPTLMTGANGILGRYLRPHLAARLGGLRSSDIRDPGAPLIGEAIMLGDLADAEFVDKLVKGVRAIVHLGAISTEDEVEKIFHSNFRGTFAVFDAAKRNGVKRIIFASSVHAIGYYTVDDRLDSSATAKPDTMYGVSKAYGENLGSFYADKFGLEVVCMRIGSVEPAPRDIRHLSTWLSFPDLARLVTACLDEPKVRFNIVYGISNNTRAWWDNSNSGIDYKPRDDAERFADKILNDSKLDHDEPANRYQGGFCVNLNVGERPVR